MAHDPDYRNQASDQLLHDLEDLTEASITAVGEPTISATLVLILTEIVTSNVKLDTINQTIVDLPGPPP